MINWTINVVCIYIYLFICKLRGLLNLQCRSTKFTLYVYSIYIVNLLNTIYIVNLIKSYCQPTII